MQQQIHQAAALSREERTVYFGFNLASLSSEMKTRLDGLAGVLRSDSQVKGARIVGYADRIGNPVYNEKLSKKRAENVRQYLIARGLINTQVADTRWLGASAPSTDCASGLSHTALVDCLQKDRRVEVEIDFTPDQRAGR
jgi:outer membrane protein OmpA-like peptidoglycan-associated protein